MSDGRDMLMLDSGSRERVFGDMSVVIFLCIFVRARTQVKRKHKNTTIISMMEARRKVRVCIASC